ncbi:DUF1634 domain-containing protein [Ligilactobacillus ceti]|uniref:Integral membrane protein n=1 Tax=Ligilactobacillus ceti DSM 22408 TaxID=1122146 RepID=A0A0R2KPV9_9LACO|nr:DUF1634 domain-containing protein [Ligilactobacillus ceti]KRN89573.1 hypothetical protein IV53_GL001251 [Ligilactobacillus ceti DSM 22408]
MNQQKQNQQLDKEMHDVEIVIGQIMRVGVIIAATFMIIGFIILLITHTGGYPGNHFPTTLKAIFTGLFHGKAYAFMMFGIFCLILTPVLRVIISIYAFLKEKDYLYVGITTLVLVILIISFILGHR